MLRKGEIPEDAARTGFFILPQTSGKVAGQLPLGSCCENHVTEMRKEHFPEGRGAVLETKLWGYL
jgi:hypothetical protein